MGMRETTIGMMASDVEMKVDVGMWERNSCRQWIQVFTVTGRLLFDTQTVSW